MNEEARKALTRLGAKMRLYAGASGHMFIHDSAWASLLFDLSEVERAFEQLETDHKTDVGKALVMATEEQILRHKRDAENDALMALLGSAGIELLMVYGKMMEPLRELLAEKIAAREKATGGEPISKAMFKRAEFSPGIDSRFITMDRRVWIELAEDVAKVEIGLGKEKEESNRLYGIGQEYDADSKEMRALLWDAHRDIMEWVRTATRIRKEIDDPDHTPWCPHEGGIQASIELADRIVAKVRKGQGDNAKN